MKLKPLFLMGLFVLVTTGCSSDWLGRGLYEGVRVRNDLQTSPSERIGKPEAPDYGSYQRMRNETSR